MAHEISFAKGKAEAAYANQPAWHGLGTVLTGKPNSAQMMEAAGLEWEVSGRPVYYRNQDGKYEQVEGYQTNVRTDIGRALGIVGADYSIVQNAAVFLLLDSLQQDGIMVYESAGALKGGRLVWALGVMPSTIDIGNGDILKRYVFAMTSHDGSQRITFTPTSVRVVCANTARIALASELALRLMHSGDMGRKLNQARLYLSAFDEKFSAFGEVAQMLNDRSIDETQFGYLIEALVPSKGKEGRALTIADKTQALMLQNFLAEIERRGEPTFWGAYNAITEFADHQKRGYRGEPLARSENKLLSTLTGSQAKFKERALELAVTMSA